MIENETTTADVEVIAPVGSSGEPWAWRPDPPLAPTPVRWGDGRVTTADDL